MKYMAVLEPEQIVEMDVLTIDIQSAVEAVLKIRGGNTVLEEALKNVKKLREVMGLNQV